MPVRCHDQRLDANGMSLTCQFVSGFSWHGSNITGACPSAVLCCIIWRLVDLQPSDENVALLVPGVYTKLSLLAQIPLTCRSIGSGVREAASELAIAATSGGLTQGQHFCRLNRRKTFNILKHEDRSQDRLQLFYGLN